MSSHRVKVHVNTAKAPRGVVRLVIIVRCECGRCRRTRIAKGWKSELTAAVDFDRRCPNQRKP